MTDKEQILGSSGDRLFAFDAEQGRGQDVFLAGIDEAGRGPLAGPVFAAAVIFLDKTPLNFLDDSKKVPARRRKILFDEISKRAFVGIGMAGETEIDTFNIYQATRLAMQRAVSSLARPPDLVLIDGPMRLDLPFRQRPIVRGDQQSASIAAASIIAKVTRDAWMDDLDKRYPVYGFARHKGYGTPEHLEKIRRFGPSPVHRRTFAPVRLVLEGEPRVEIHAE